MSALLEIRDLRKVFHLKSTDGSQRDLVAVNDVSFSVEHGGSLAVVGESGSGKSTIARIVAGLETPTSGKIFIDGIARDPGRVNQSVRRQRARQVQMVFQDPNSSLDPHQTLGDALDEVLRLHTDLDREKRSQRVATLLDQVGLDPKHADSLPRRISGGQRQRAAIARALAAEPRLLILDEAVAALDVSVQAQVLNLLSDLRTTLNVSYLFISHDLAVVRQVSETCVVMHRGRVVETGSTQVVLDSPQEPYTQRLLDALPRAGWTPRLRGGVSE